MKLKKKEKTAILSETDLLVIHSNKKITAFWNVSGKQS